MPGGGSKLRLRRRCGMSLPVINTGHSLISRKGAEEEDREILRTAEIAVLGAGKKIFFPFAFDDQVFGCQVFSFLCFFPV